LPRGVTALKFVGYLDVQIALIPGIGLVFKLAIKSLALLNCQYLTKIEYSLLPMSVFGVGAGGEANGFVAGGEFYIEPGDKSMNEIIASGAEVERYTKGKVGCCDRVEIEGQHGAWICHKCFDFDGVDKRFCERILLHWREIESVDVVPD
jgi:hypothetical protein